MPNPKDIDKFMENFYKLNISKGKPVVANFFMSIGYSKATAYRKIKRIGQGSLKRKPGSGRKPTVATVTNIKKLTEMFNNKSGCSLKKAGKKFNCDKSCISKILKNKTNIRCFKKIKKPKRTANQMKNMRPKCRKMSEFYHDLDFIMDDESYFTLSNSSLAGNDRFYTDNRDECPDDVKYKYKSKFEKKLLVWIAICPKGMSRLYFAPSKQAINEDIYINECLNKRLVPMVQELYGKNRKFVFWPDLASSHYSRATQKYLNSKKFKYVDKEINPANTPESRPIEDFWSELKRMVYENNWEATTLDQLETRIKYCYSKIDKKIFLKYSANVHKRLNRIAKYGIKAR